MPINRLIKRLTQLYRLVVLISKLDSVLLVSALMQAEHRAMPTVSTYISAQKRMVETKVHQTFLGVTIVELTRAVVSNRWLFRLHC
mgnify:FL=1